MRLLVIVILVVLGNAQQQIPSAQATSPSGQSSQVPAQMRLIVDALAGTWSFTWIDKAGSVIGHGVEVWKVAPGGSAFIEENNATLVNGKPAGDYAATWWDSKANKVHGIWCEASINDEGCSGFDVTLTNGKDVVMTGEWEHAGKSKAWREVYSVSGNTLRQTLYVGEPGKTLQLANTIQGTKR